MYDVTVIGGGPAGFAAAMYLGRKRLKAALFEGEVFGGQMARTGFIDDYPGVLQIDGPGLTEIMKKQAESTGAEIKSEEITEIEIIGNKSFRVRSAKNAYECKAVIMATGVEVRKLDVPGEEEFAGRGVSYCAVCDAPLFRNKTVAVVGGGNSAVGSAQLLSKYAARVYLIHRRSEFRADPLLLDAVMLGTRNIEPVLNSVVEKIEGTKFVEKIVLKSAAGAGTAAGTGATNSELKVDGVFVEIGGIPTSQLVKPLGVALNEGGYIKVDKSQATSVPGIFAAGDVTDFRLKQVATAVGQGAQAAISAADYLML